jgi:Ca2+-binding RTX toxin-like protein
MSVTIFADTILDFFDSGAGPFPGPYGRVDLNGNGFDDFGEPPLGPIPIEAVLGDDPGPDLDFVSLPTGSFVTVGFSNATIIDGPGNDIFIRETGAAGDRAEVYVSSVLSSDPADFTLLGIAQDDITTAFDLGAAGFIGTVQAIKIVGLDERGTAPGFDVVNVQARNGDTAAGNRVRTGTDLKDVLTGGQQADTLLGEGGNDRIVCRGGDDFADGGDGNDNINAGNGDDEIIGGSGRNRIRTGNGNDTCVATLGPGFDIIIDFQDGADQIELPENVSIRDLTVDFRGPWALISIDIFSTNSFLDSDGLVAVRNVSLSRGDFA